MNTKSKCIAIIPARGGSKRIPRKNIKEFLGKPLIVYSIETAIASNLFDKVVVSTDDEEIAQIAKRHGAEVPFLRPKELSDEFTGIAQVVAHTIEFLEQKDEHYFYACTIYATAPFIQEIYLREGYTKIINNDIKRVFSATTMPFPIQRTFKLNNDGRCEMFYPEHFYTRSQDLEEAYQDAGQFSWNNLKKKSDKITYDIHSMPVILPRHLVQDIDTFEDWERAEFLYKQIHANKEKQIVR